MEKKGLKKLLAGLGIVSLIGAGSVTIQGCGQSGSGWAADKNSAGGAEKSTGSGWSGSKDSTGSAEKKKTGDSGWGGTK